jgi:hypothetical protein
LKTDQINIRLPADLLQWLDDHWQEIVKTPARTGKQGHRARAIEELIRQGRDRLKAHH